MTLSRSELLTAALEYTAQGFAVFPLHTIAGGICTCESAGSCTSPGKHPRLKGGAHSATTDAQTVNAWWEVVFPQSNIGIQTGGYLVAIDVDPRHDGAATLERLQSEIGVLPPTWTQQTGGGGVHYLFTSPERIRNSAAKFGSGVDIRGEGGYIVAAPSIHVSGAKYAQIPGTPDCPVSLPNGWLDLLSGRTHYQPEEEIFRLTTGGNELPEKFTDGQRNSLLTSLAGRLRRTGLARPEIEAALLAANQTRCQPPLRDREVIVIARSVSRYPAGSLPDPAFSILTTTDSDSGISAAADADPIPTDSLKPADLKPPGGLAILSLGEMDLILYEEPDPVIWGLYPGEVGQISALPNAGKSTLMLNLCLSLACGRAFKPLVSAPPPQPVKVLYLDFENRPARFKKDLLTMRQRLSPVEDALVAENFFAGVDLTYQGQQFSLTDNRCLIELVKILRQRKIQFLVIDTLAQAATLFSENDNAEIQRKIVRPMNQLGKLTGVAILIVHHQGKAGESIETSSRNLYSGRGASSLPAAARLVLTLAPVVDGSNDLVKLSIPKVKGEQFTEVVFSLDKAARWYDPTDQPPPVTLSDQILAAIEQTMPEGLSLKEICEEIEDYSRSAISETIKRLIAGGKLTKGGTVRGGRKYLIATGAFS